MPFDERASMALGALQRPIADFRATLSGALTQAAAFLTRHRGTPGDLLARTTAELGPFALGRIDVASWAALMENDATITPEAAERLERAIAILHDMLERGDALFLVDVPSGTNLAEAVGRALARLGRAFGAVLAVEKIRGNAYVPAEHDALLDRLEFRSWTRSERRYAPPLVVMVDGADLHVGGLSDFTDGREKVVLVVRGPCPPAPLVRLITPGTMVLQTADGTGLDRVAASDDPAVAALVPADAALFLHDPAGGAASWQRVAVWHVPTPPKKPFAGFSPRQMEEDLKQLSALTPAPSLSPLSTGATDHGAASGADTVDRLANWLLSQADLKASG